ncbi:MAG: collagen-like protein [Clostridiales bacterium]|nr:collagen-like protein [Clostridiales bacterium]
MKKSKIFAALALSACMALGTTGLIACAPNNGSNGGNTGDTENKSIMRVYEAYVAAAEANGEDVLDYDAWYADLLANAKGEKGDKGEKGETGAKGDKGDNGENGKDGNGWLVGTTAPTAEQGNDGDLYLDSATWNVYHKVSGAWVLLGNIKGADGVGGGSQGGGDVTPETPADTTISVETNGTYDMPISGITTGIYIIEADLGSDKLSSSSRLYAQIGENGKSWFDYSESRSTDGHNVYWAFIKISEEDTAITFSTIYATVNAKVVIKEWETPTLTVDTPVEMPVNIYQTAAENIIKIKLDTSIDAGTYKIYVDGNSEIIGAVKFFAGAKSVSITSANYDGIKTIQITEDLLSSGEVYVYLIGGASSSAVQISPVTVTLEFLQA